MNLLPRFGFAPVLLVLSCVSGFASVQKDFFQGNDLSIGNNYNPAGVPTSGSDLLLTTTSTALTLNGASLTMSSINQLNNSAYTIANGSFTLSPSGNVVSPNPSDVIYLGGSNSNLTIATPLLLTFGTINVAQSGGVLNLTGSVSTNPSTALVKAGAGTLNLSGSFGDFGGFLRISGGTTNFLPGFQVGTAPRTGLFVDNSNTGEGNAVILSVQTSVQFRGLNGTIATPSSGLNTAKIDLMGSGVELKLEGTIIPGGSYAGTISGSGRVTVNLSGDPTVAQTFSGANTYTGTTTVNGGILRINGTTTGQGDYFVRTTGFTFAVLTGSGTIGLAPNGRITVGGNPTPSQISAGGDSATGTLTVVTSGTGGVIFSSQSVFTVDIGPAGASDLLSIAGGYIDLTGSSDTLALNGLAGAFDGSAYTIATFTQNLGGGTFNTVTGLPANYVVSYTSSAIRLLPIPEPTTWALGLQALAILIWRKRDRVPHAIPYDQVISRSSCACTRCG